jgi:hypothetical protein
LNEKKAKKKAKKAAIKLQEGTKKGLFIVLASKCIISNLIAR